MGFSVRRGTSSYSVLSGAATRTTTGLSSAASILPSFSRPLHPRLPLHACHLIGSIPFHGLTFREARSHRHEHLLMCQSRCHRPPGAWDREASRSSVLFRPRSSSILPLLTANTMPNVRKRTTEGTWWADECEACTWTVAAFSSLCRLYYSNLFDCIISCNLDSLRNEVDRFWDLVGKDFGVSTSTLASTCTSSTLTLDLPCTEHPPL